MMCRGGIGINGSIVLSDGSVIGPASALLLARDGHEVTVLERDPRAL
jgi:2-polyprenyl-6-methoxyphenol hydroxylase-like FAD-dependent oxidoreductase